MQLARRKQEQIPSHDTHFWFLALIFFFSTPFIEQKPLIDTAFTALRCIAILFLFTRIKTVIVYDQMNFLILLSQIALLFSTYQIGSPIITMVKQLISYTVLCFTINTMMKTDARKCLNVLCLIFGMLVTINFLTMVFFYQNGLYTPGSLTENRKYFFLGHQNQMNIYAIIAMTLQYINAQITADPQKRRKKYICFFALCTISIVYAFLVWSVTTIICCCMLVGLFFADHKLHHGLVIPFSFTILLNISVFLAIAVFQKFHVFDYFFTEVLHRDVTFSGRTYIWEAAVNVFLKHPFWGVGIGRGYAVFGHETAHNRYMNIMFTGGIVSIIIFICILITLQDKLLHTGSGIVRVTLLALFVIFLAMQEESLEGFPFYVMLMVAYNIEELLNEPAPVQPRRRTRYARVKRLSHDRT